jgi:hypothetical protein
MRTASAGRLSEKSARYSQLYLFTIPLICTLFILPKSNFDPISVPKLSILLLLLFVYLVNTEFWQSMRIADLAKSKSQRIVLLFIVVLILNLIVNH